MRIQNRKFLLLLAALLCGPMLLAPAAASAQQNACVYLKPGAGYAAEMRIVYGDLHTSWSGSFPIGEHKCQSLSDVPDGSTYSVQVHAIAGHTKTCSPKSLVRDASSPLSVTFLASGTTLNVHCDMPGTETAAAEKSTPAGETPPGTAAGPAGPASAESRESTEL